MNTNRPLFSQPSFRYSWQSPFSYRISIALLVSMHMAGLIGLNWSVTRPIFTALIPFNLLTTAAIVLFSHQSYDKRFLAFGILAFGIGFGIEVLGVKSGVIFGQYQYGPVLGWKLWEVPLLIGGNWFTLSYCTGVIADKMLTNNWLKPIVAALLMVSIDVLIEPIATYLNFWTWYENRIPFQNYVGWFVVSLLIQVFFRFLVSSTNNSAAPLVYLMQFVFFLGFNLFLGIFR